MLSYHDALHTDLSALTDAAEKWEKAAEMFKNAAKIYDQKVKGIFEDGSASGQHAQAGLLATGTTSGQYTGAQKEAKAIAEILRDAHHQFVEMRGKLKSEIADAKQAKMLISADKGVCSWDWDNMDSKTKRAVTHDGSAESVPHYWTERIAKAVKNMDDADHGVKLALDAVTVDSAPVDGIKDGFNAKAEGDIEKVEGKRADELSTKLASEGKLPAKEMAELERLFRDNSDDKAFSRTYLNGLGAENTIKLGNKLREMGKDGNAVEKGLTQSIATATELPKKDAKLRVGTKAYEKWLDSPAGRFNKKFLGDLKEVGAKNFGSNTEPVYGYQDFVTLMEQGGGYGKQFTHHLANDIIATEGKKEGLWDIWNGKPVQKGIEHDPLDGVLGLMSKDPASSTEYLDPQHNDHLKYLLKDRDWPSYMLNGPGSVNENDTLSDISNRHGFGAALESAATGHQPGSEHSMGDHSVPQARIMQDTINLLDEKGQAEKMPSGIRANVGHALMDYTPDTHLILGNEDLDYRDHENKGPWSDDGRVKMSVEQQKLVKVMRGVAEDGNTFGQMYRAEHQYVADTFAGMPNDTNSNHTKTPIMEASHAMGMYDGVLADVNFDSRDEKIQSARDFNHTVGLVSGAGLNFVPAEPAVLGKGADIANRVVDMWNYEHMKSEISDIGTEATQENARKFNLGEDTVDRTIAAWGETHGHEQSSDFTKAAIGLGQGRHSDGREKALLALRPDF